MKRPSYYVLLCAVLVLATFSASGHLAVGRPPARSSPPPLVRSAQPPVEVGGLPVHGVAMDTMGFLLVGADVADGRARTSTDADGRFLLEVPRRTFADLCVSASSYKTAIVRAFPGVGEPLVAALEPAAPWDPPAAAPAVGDLPALFGEGTVRSSDRQPLAGALVFVAETGALSRTDEAGRYEIALPPGPSTLIVHDPDAGPDGHGEALRSEPFDPHRTRGRVPLPELQSRPAVVLRGLVRDGKGQPQKGVPLQLVGSGFARTIASGDGGAFHVGGLLPGDYELRVFAFRGAFGDSRRIALRATVTDCEVQLRSVPERRLQVVTEAGAPVARAIVATTVDGLRREVVRGDDAGWVQVRAAEPEASFDVRTGEDYRQMRVVAASEAPGRLIVALP